VAAQEQALETMALVEVVAAVLLEQQVMVAMALMASSSFPTSQQAQ
jgi:hypothetical protein